MHAVEALLNSWTDRAKEAKDAGILCDINDGSKFPERITEAGPCDRVLALMLAFDPFQPFKDNAKYSVYPWLVVSGGGGRNVPAAAAFLCTPPLPLHNHRLAPPQVPANAPPNIRWTHGVCSTLGLQPGTHKENVQVSPLPVLGLIIDELLFAHHVGFVVNQFDGAGQTQKVEVKVVLLFLISDYRGLAYFTGDSIKQSPAHFACFKSWLAGKRYHAYKTVYQTHAQ